MRKKKLSMRIATVADCEGCLVEIFNLGKKFWICCSSLRGRLPKLYITLQLIRFSYNKGGLSKNVPVGANPASWIGGKHDEEQSLWWACPRSSGWNSEVLSETL